MKRARYLLIGILSVLPLLGWMTIAHAQSFRSGNNVTVSSNQVVNNTLFAAGKTVDIAGTVNGDVFCAGQNVNVSATVHGDVICSGQDISITGRVLGDVRLAGQDVTIGGTVRDNASVAGQSFVIDSRGQIGQDLSAASGTVELNGLVGRDVAISATDLNLNNGVGRNVQASVNQLTLGSTAKVGGSITYSSHNTLHKANGAMVNGTITRHTPTAHHGHFFVGWLFAIYIFVALLVVALVLVLLFPRVFEHAALMANASKGRTLLVGFAASILMPILLAVIAMTLIGLPLALLAGLAWLLVVLLAGPFAAYLLGTWLIPRHRNPIIVMLLGASILFLLYLLPILGFLIWLVAAWFGIGMILRQLFFRVGRPHYDMTELRPTVGETQKAGGSPAR